MNICSAIAIAALSLATARGDLEDKAGREYWDATIGSISGWLITGNTRHATFQVSELEPSDRKRVETRLRDYLKSNSGRKNSPIFSPVGSVEGFPLRWRDLAFLILNSVTDRSLSNPEFLAEKDAKVRDEIIRKSLKL